MQKKLLFIILLSVLIVSSQEDIEQVVEPKYNAYITQEEVSKDLEYNLNSDFSKNRTFKSNLKDKYSGSDFTYIDHIEKEKQTPPPPKTNTNNSSEFMKLFVHFMTSIFPFILGIIVVIIILRIVLSSEKGFWKFGKSNKKVYENLVYEDINTLSDNNFDLLLKQALYKKNYRLATRYYYLIILQKLSQKKLIDFHKDKTNAEYVSELQNKQMQNHFSHLLYIYNYVWYGEFPINEIKFITIEKKYQLFIKNL